MIYLDSAATSLIKPLGVSAAVQRAMALMASPGRGAYPPAMLAAETLYDCRTEAAALFDVPEPEQVVFTFNATHALNLAIHSLIKPGAKVLISGFEHNSVYRPLRALGGEIRIAGRRVFDPQDTMDSFRRQIPQADAVVCTQVSNAFGYILPLEEIAECCWENRVPLIVDASQGAGILPISLRKLHAAFIAMPGHKGLYGPQGTGLLLCGAETRPLLFGGSGSESRSPVMPELLPDRLEAGTHNVCGIAGLLAGIRFVREKGTEAILRHERQLLCQTVEEMSGEGLELFTGAWGTQSGVLSFRAPNWDCETLAQALAERGICLRSGLHCAPLAHESVGTLESGTLRLSFSAFTGQREIELACRELRTILR